MEEIRKSKICTFTFLTMFNFTFCLSSSMFFICYQSIKFTALSYTQYALQREHTCMCVSVCACAYM